jgi:Uma2 family endonuclease
MAAQPARRLADDRLYLSVEDYLALDADAPEGVRYERYADGEVVALAGADPDHNQVKGNIASALHAQLTPRGCRVASSDQRVHLGERYVYPDVVVACDPRYGEDRPRSLLTPDLLVEVTSPTTAGRDEGAKLGAYREIESLREYWIAAPDAVRLLQYVRHAEGWLVRIHTRLDAVVTCEALDVTLALADAYALVLPLDEDPDAEADAASGDADAAG